MTSMPFHRHLSTYRVKDALHQNLDKKTRTIAHERERNVSSTEREQVQVRGWIRTVRRQKQNVFIEVNDGSCLDNLQIVVSVDKQHEASTASHTVVRNDKKDAKDAYVSKGNNVTAKRQSVLDELSTGCSVEVRGTLVRSLKNPNVNELLVESLGSEGEQSDALRVVGTCDRETYPLQKKRHSLEFMREIAHLRPRSNTTAAMLRVRNALTMAVNEYFQEQHFYMIHAPILTSSDCEGAGEMFQVICNNNSHEGEYDNGGKSKKHKNQSKEGQKMEKQPIEGYVTEEQLQHMKTDFFGTEAFLTVSGQLQAEIFASAMSRVYTFGPTFRAEMSKTNRHLAEFWMVEMEQAFADLNELMKHGEGLIKHCVKRVIERCEEDLLFFQKYFDKGLMERLQHTLEKPFQVITYTDAIQALQKSGTSFRFPVEWGCNLQSEHEIYLSETHFGGTPVFIINYPRDIKPFYARVDEDSAEDRNTVAAVDMVVPRLGELIGGSVREERMDVLLDNMNRKGMDNLEYYQWYIDLRKYGSVPHGGFGVGFERLVMYLTGLDNIRDVIPVPRATSHLLY